MPARKSDHRKSVGDAGGPIAVTATPGAESAATQQPQGSSPAAGAAAAAAGAGAAPERKEKEAKDKDHKDKDAVTIEDLTLPKSIITRLAKGVLPPNTQIQANAILAMSKSATVFINYLASHANEHTVNAGKKTVLPADVFKALDDTEFSFLREPLEAEFAKFNAIKTEKRTSYRAKVKSTGKDEAVKRQPPSEDADMADQTASAATAHAPDTIVSASSGQAPHRAKKPRVDRDATEDEDEDDEDDDDADQDEHEGAEDDEEDEIDEEDDEDEDDAEGGGRGSGDETQDALEEREAGDEGDEAIDGDESD
ncbi:DNA-directed DNA polymerase [Purpureocillium takamizusanense]|uniref:DNA polymerase epsilon subunit D n=1 Tax=Purpureocillium takamizusanense TaxID=2060973 RepID=A0A9Q8Q9A1_9HYPO|nr:DNA-directed DNA polymerase [Purpureocillium takamizusanense]UNI15041.1 DNA-directed DNA polymerase [Purpureocillium takamizusanense]